MWNSMFAKVHNHSRIKSLLQSIYLKSSVHKLWIRQRTFPLQFRFDFIPGNCYKVSARLQQGSLFTLSFSFKICDKRQIAHVHHDASRATTHTAPPPGTPSPAHCTLGSFCSSRLSRIFLCGHPGPELEKGLWVSHASKHISSYTTSMTITSKTMILVLMLPFPYYKNQSCTLPVQTRSAHLSKTEASWLQCPASAFPFATGRTTLFKNMGWHFLKNI